MRISECFNSGFRGAVEAAFGFIGESLLSLEDLDVKQTAFPGDLVILRLPGYFEALSI